MPSLASEVSENVHRIDSRLAWEFGPGHDAHHALVVSPEGNPEIRPIAIAWLASAPHPDPVWEYHASRQAGNLGRLKMLGTEVDMGEARVLAHWEDTRHTFAIQVWHPMFAGLPVEARNQVAFLFLDNLLGEDEVERWVGSFGLADEPSGSMAPEEFKAEVEARSASGDSESWVLAEVKDAKGFPVALVTANAALKPIDHPLADHHLAVTIDRGFEQLANNPSESDGLAAAQDELEADLGDTAVPAGRVTERRTRTLWYICEDSAAVERTAKAWADRSRRYRINVRVKCDPGWTFRRGLLGQAL